MTKTTNVIREGAGSADRESSRTASSATGESFADQMSRVGLMAEGDPQWDLSENDCAALHAVLCSHDALLDIAKTIVALCDSGNVEHAQIACMETSPLVDAAREAIANVEGSHVA